jgi:hypothetical protein
MLRCNKICFVGESISRSSIIDNAATMADSLTSSTRNIDDDDHISSGNRTVSNSKMNTKNCNAVLSVQNRFPTIVSAMTLVCAMILWVVVIFVVPRRWKTYNSVPAVDNSSSYIYQRDYGTFIAERKRYRKLLNEIVLGYDNNSDFVEKSELNLLRLNSPEWKAMQWMIFDDPLALNYFSMFDALLRDIGLDYESFNSLAYLDICESKMNSTTLNACEKLVQRYALATLYFASAGDQAWNNLAPSSGWVRHTSIGYTLSHPMMRIPLDECEWLGVKCASGSIRTLNLSQALGFTINGIIFPLALAKLTHLEILDLSKQGLKGRLPNQFYSSLSSLKKLDLEGNQLTRVFSGEVDNMNKLSKMEVLSVKDNRLMESLPTLSGLVSLKIAKLDGNRYLEGNFWDDAVRYWPRIEFIDISFTLLGGAISDLPGKLLTVRNMLQTVNLILTLPLFL